MKSIEKRMHTSGFIFSSIAGVMLHYIYEATGRNTFASIIGAVNESTWEHLKLLFFPVVLFSIIEFFIYGKQHKNFIPSKVYSVIMGMTAIVVLFYTYTGIFGTHFAFIDIMLFFIGLFVTYFSSYKFIKNGEIFTKPTSICAAVSLLVLITAMFTVFTFYPPDIGIFKIP